MTPKPNYRQQKRQKELSRKSRHDEKLQKRTGKGVTAEAVDPGASGEQASTAPSPSTP